MVGNSNLMEADVVAGAGGGSRGEEIGSEPRMDLHALPEGCIATVLSLTTPGDVCSLASLSTTFKSAAEFDAVWESFLPNEYKSIVSRSPSTTSKKDLYLSLCDNPVFIDYGKKCFSLDKRSGKKCYMLSSRDLMIVWSDTPMYWRWTPLNGARFSEGAELVTVCWFDIRGNIKTSLLFPNTLYAAYLVFKLTTRAYGFDHQPLEVTVGLVGSEGCKRSVILDPEGLRRERYQIVPRRFGSFNRGRILGLRHTSSATPSTTRNTNTENHPYPKVRRDGWLELELGEFFNKGDTNGELEMSILETKCGNWKGGIIVLGIDIRPKECKRV